MTDENVRSTTRKRCAFCGAQDRKISNEHIVGRRWGDIFAGGSLAHRRFGWKLGPDGKPGEPWDVSWRSSKGLDFKVNAVCRDCNSGWMASLDDAVEPFTRPMVEDAQRQNLGVEESAVLARWIAKTAVMIATAQDASWTYSPAQAAEIMAGGFPAGFRVWALAWLGEPMVHLWTTPIAGPAPERRLAHCVTSFTFGRMYFLAMHSPDPGFPVGLESLLGRSVDSRNREWSCPPSLDRARPDMLPEYHLGVVRERVRVYTELGIFAWPNGEEPAR